MLLLAPYRAYLNFGLMSFDRRVRIFFFFQFSLAAAYLIFTMFGRLETEVADAAVHWKISPGNIVLADTAGFYKSKFPEGVDDYLPVDLRKNLSSIESANRSSLILKIVWVLILAGQLASVAMRSSHSRYFAPAVGMLTAVVVCIHFVRHIAPVSVPGMVVDPGTLGMVRGFTIAAYVLMLVLLAGNGYFVFSSQTRGYFHADYIRPVLIPLEKRNEIFQKFDGEFAAKTLEVSVHILLLIIAALIIGNLIYVPLFLTQVRFPAATFIMIATIMLFMQVFYFRGYYRAWQISREKTGEPAPVAQGLVFALSYLGFRILTNISRILGWVMFITTVILILLVIILNNIGILEKVIEVFELLPPEKSL